MAAPLDDKQALQLAGDLIDETFFGILTTVDDAGQPHARWMGAATIDGLPTLYTITTTQARKCRQIEKHPAVCWLFSSADGGDVVTLHGRAEVTRAPVVTQHVWDRLVPCAQRYAMDVLGHQEEPSYCVIATRVEQIEVLSPRLGQFSPYSLKAPTAPHVEPHPADAAGPTTNTPANDDS